MAEGPESDEVAMVCDCDRRCRESVIGDRLSYQFKSASKRRVLLFVSGSGEACGKLGRGQWFR